MLIAAAIVLGCHAIDGDTIRCGQERIRLLAIDAPEMPGHCRRGRVCAPGDPFAARAALEQALRLGPVTVVRVRIGAWGRTDADVLVNGQSLSCLQLRAGHAVYWRRYDRGRRIARECGLDGKGGAASSPQPAP
jgi:micrococcal nuclease